MFFGIEGIPVIIRFKTEAVGGFVMALIGIEGIPVIIRFKTKTMARTVDFSSRSIEGIPVIIRFKTPFPKSNTSCSYEY